ncbi:MAG: AraC family transcriptional regulator [Aquabacterium sp.]
MSTKASVKSVWDFRRGIATARVLTQLGADHGVPLDNLLRHTGITRAMLDDPKAEIEAHQEVQLIRNLINELPHIPTLGLQAGTRYHVTTYGLWGYAVLSSPTLGTGISMASRMLNLTFSLTINEIEQLGDQIRSSFLSDHLPPDVRQFILDRDRAAVITLQREILGHPLPFRAIHMRRSEPAPEVVDAYASLFGIRPTFGQARDCALFDSALMHEPLPQADAHTAALCEQMCRRLVEARKSRTGVAAQVRDRLLRTPGHIPDMEEIAAEMKITSRTLRRHLTAEGATFRALLEEVRSTLAEELMATASLTHGEIAERLGYADVTTFIEAFRRWKGMPPSEFRRSLGLPAQATRAARRRFIPR